MSKALRARSGAEQKPEAAKAEAAPAQGGPGNAYMAELLQQAIIDAKAEDSLLSLDAHEEEDPGKYHFPEDDTRKQQQDELPGLREQHASTPYTDHEGGKAFVKGSGDANDIDPNDVKQGSLGDCYLMAGMLAVARANPEAIRDLIKDNGDGTFEVTLYIRETRYGKPVAVTKTVDARLPGSSTPVYAKAGDKEGEDEELWAALIEKTVAQHKGSYDKISGGNIGKDGFQFHGATELLTGAKEGYLPTDGMDEDDALLHIAIALDEKKPVTCDSRDMSEDAELSKEATKVNVYGNHAYGPENVDLDGRKIDLQNPWGSSHVKALPVKDFLRFYRAIRIGA